MTCSHLDMIALPPACAAARVDAVCAVCVAQGSTWVHLRMCRSCGVVGCCDSSPGRHARAHWREARHPVIASHEPGEDWSYCYADADMVAD